MITFKGDHETQLPHLLDQNTEPNLTLLKGSTYKSSRVDGILQSRWRNQRNEDNVCLRVHKAHHALCIGRLHQFHAGMGIQDTLYSGQKKKTHCIVNNNDIAVLIPGFLPSFCAISPDSKLNKWPLARTFPRVSLFYHLNCRDGGVSINPMPGTSCALNIILVSLRVIFG